MRMAFFATPILWKTKDIGFLGSYILQLNPFTYYLAIVRDPLLLGSVDPRVWIVTFTMTVSLIIVSVILLSIYKDKVQYML